MTSKVLGSPLMTIKNELLHGAVVRGELPTVRRLLDRHSADINTKNSNGMTCLQLAILNGHTKLAEFLIQKGVDIHMSDPDGYTALHDASLEENAVLVRKLISKGLSPLVAANLGELPIDVAGSLQMEKMLCEEMYQAGEVQLARQYYLYLALQDQDKLKFGMQDGGRSLISYGGHAHSSPPQRSHVKHAGQPHPVGCKSSINAHNSSPKFEAKKSTAPQTDFQVSRNLPTTCASRVHPSAETDCVLVSGHHMDAMPCANIGSLPSDCKRNHRNAGGVAALLSSQEAYKEQLQDTDAAQSASLEPSDRAESEVVSAAEDSCDLGDVPLRDTPTTTTRENSSTVQSIPPEATSSSSHNKHCNLSPELARASAAINNLQLHSSFQLQIGLSLQSQQFSSLEEAEEDIFAASASQEDSTASSSLSPSTGSSFSSSAEVSSPCLSSRSKQRTPLQSDWFLTAQAPHTSSSSKATPSPRARRNQRVLQKSVSFADFHMTRSKPMFVGPSNQTSGGGGGAATATSTATAEKKTKSSHRTNQLGHLLSFSTNVLDRYISNYNPARAKEGEDGVSSMFDAGIRALRMKPQKSSMMRRHNSEGGIHLQQQRRRSVTFQPEVLLQEIVTAGDVKAVSEILESGMINDVNKMSPSGLTALHQSAIDGNLECAKTLVANGADVNCTDCENWTPLHAAVMNGSAEFVRFLIASGAKPNLKNDSGETSYDMAKNGPIRKMLLNAMNGQNPDADEFSDGEYSGAEEEEEYSHAESESDDELEGDGSGLFDATVGGTASLKERLGLMHTSALNNAHTNSVTPSPDLDNVFANGSQTYPRREHDLTDSTSSYGSLFESDGKLKEGSNAGISSSGGDQSSGTKISESDTDKISESGISTMEGSSDGSHRSRVLSSEDEAITLDSDLDPDSVEYEFQEACLYCDVDRVMKLTKYTQDIDVNRVNKASGITALHHSVLEENFALVQHLVKDFEADLHVQDIEGWTPLHAASAVGSIQIAQFLLERGAKPSSLNLSCEFPVDVAEDEAMEKLLKKAMLGHATEKGLR